MIMFTRKRKKDAPETPIYDLENEQTQESEETKESEESKESHDSHDSQNLLNSQVSQTSPNSPTSREGIAADHEENSCGSRGEGTKCQRRLAAADDDHEENSCGIREEGTKCQRRLAADDMMRAFEAWLEDSMPDAERREAARDAMGMVRDAIDGGEFDEAIFDVIAKGADYDRAVAEAAELADAEARNACIDEFFEKAKGDGVPHPGSESERGNGLGPSIFDLARSAF